MARPLLKHKANAQVRTPRTTKTTTDLSHKEQHMKTTLNFFDRLMIAVTFAEAGVTAADCTPASRPATPAHAKKAETVAESAKARG